jgi:acyl-CoA dehydrogenase
MIYERGRRDAQWSGGNVDAAVFADVLSGTRRFVRERVVPREAEIDEKDEIPEDVREAARQLGLYGFALPEEHGGLGLSMAEEVQLVFELGYTTPALRSMFGTNNGIAGHVLMVGGTGVAAAAGQRRGHRVVRTDGAGGRLGPLHAGYPG